MFSFGQIAIFIGLGVLLLLIALLIRTKLEYEEAIIRAIPFIAFVVIMGGIVGFTAWYNNHTASGIRLMKDFQSELNNGIEREVTIYAEDGREIFHYEGKIDIESNHEDNYIKFESEDGKRYIIYYGVQDTIMIIEK